MLLFVAESSNKLSDNDWNLITKQFTIVWEQCWDSNAKLLYHAFSSEKLSYWTSNADIWDTAQTDKTKWTSMTAAGHSAAFWGRAEGWYFLALVDVLEQMKNAGQESTNNYSTLLNYLTTLADGIKDRQDATTGCWYQLVGKDYKYKASYYNGSSANEKSNYLESSCTAIFTAAYLKAIRLGLLAKETYFGVAEKAYQGMVKQFMKQRTDGTVDLLGCCKSAGVGTAALGEDRFRDGSNAYYLHGYDVTPTSTKSGDYYTEGKVLGAFILAATEYERQYQPSMLLSNDLNKTYTLGPNESLSAEVLGEGSATYQWYDATTSTAITGAINASYTPTKSGKYYCKITVTPTTAAKTRGASTELYTITTSTADVTVAAAGGETGGSVTGEVIYFPQKSTTTSNPDVLSATGSMKTDPGEITYKGNKYSNALKMEKSTSVKLNLSSESVVVLVFNSKNSGYKITVDGKEYTIGSNGLVTIPSLAAGNHEIKRSNGESHLYAVDIQPTAPSISISISTQPASAEYLTGATTVTPLTVGATLDGYTLSYQWYKNTTNSNTGGTVISGATAKSYTPTLSNTGTTYYYCVVTATKEGSETLTATSDVAAITVSAPYVKFTTQPTSGSYAINNAASALTVVAATNLGVDITYQWYSNSSKATEGSTLIENATSASYTPSTSTVGTKYYYCKASATLNGKTYEDISNIVSIEVVTAIYKYKVASGDKSPGVNGVKYIKDKAGNTKVKMTFGGWKWGTNENNNDHTYTMPNKDKPLTDSWSDATTEGVDKLDGYDYWFSGGQDAVDESRASNGIIYGTERFGWFKTQTRDDANNVITYPFTLPVRGAYMTFEPTENGWLTIYILQNGAWNSDTKKGIEIKPGEFRMHSFFITNQRGLTVQDFAPNMYSYEVNQKVATGYSCSEYDESKKPAVMDTTKTDISYWPEFWTLNAEERQAVHDHWKNGDNESETVIELSNGSFLLIQKAVIKYRFHVTGSETYYFFSNFSKMGFSGATFQPDNAQPTEALSLSDTKEYTTPTAGTDAVVGNVTIPQYKSITFTRTFKPNQWTTLTLPFNLTQEEVQKIFGDGTQIIMLDKATLSSEGGARLHFIYHEIQNVLPGYPYLIKPTLKNIENDAVVDIDKDAPDADEDNTPLTSFTVYGKCINPFIDQFEVKTTPYTFKGTPGYCTADVTKDGITTNYSVNYEANDIFVSEGNGNLYVSSGASYGKGYRSWIAKKTVAEGGTSQTAKSISVVMSSFSDDDDTTTSIDVAEMAPDLIEALGIQTGVYNLSGQRVANDTRNLKAGIYIVNGKKTVVR